MRTAFGQFASSSPGRIPLVLGSRIGSIAHAVMHHATSPVAAVVHD
ncbi:hypothetical protein ACH4U5_09020 [Streptomyces sp. NPDC020858]